MLEDYMKSYFELKVLFTNLKNKAAVKRDLLMFLQSQAMEFVEEMVDGIDTPTESIYEDEERRALPLAVYFETEEAAKSFFATLREKFNVDLTCSVTRIDGVAWSSSWREEQTVIETHLFIVSPGNHSSTDKTKHLLKLKQDGVAFGDGRHATTESCILALEKLDLKQASACLDIGTGTGILTIAAAKLGIDKLHATEISQDLVREANENFALNKVAAECLLKDDISHIESNSCELVIANILIPVILSLIPEIKRVVSENGYILLSGFIEKEAEIIREKMTAFASEVLCEDVRGWKTLVFRKQEP
jgi:ribosomal protein L11 methyltransferase